MTKNFCDICGKPAEIVPSIESVTRCEALDSFEAETSPSYSPFETKLAARLVLSYVEHPCQIGLRPINAPSPQQSTVPIDICRDCLINLVEKLLKEAKDARR